MSDRTYSSLFEINSLVHKKSGQGEYQVQTPSDGRFVKTILISKVHLVENSLSPSIKH